LHRNAVELSSQEGERGRVHQLETPLPYVFALEKCAGECKVVPVTRACGAIAIDGTNACGPHGYAVARRLGQAQNTALRHCYEYGGKECVIRACACDAKG
jgi:Domain of unknown function (DUF4189)